MFNRLVTRNVVAQLCAVTAVSVLPVFGQLSTQLNALTGSQRTRIAWIQGGDVLLGGGALLGYDSQTDSTKQILAVSAQQNKPIICSGGYRVVITRNFQTYVVNWDGTGLRLITDGIASDVWVDPASGLEWVVVRKGGNLQTDNSATAGTVHRYLLDDPTADVLLWDRTKAGDYYMDWYQISADGKMAADFLPWDRGFVIDSGGLVANGFQTNFGRGCWSSLTPDNSYISFHFPWTGPAANHLGFSIYRDKALVDSAVLITAPAVAGHPGFFHPKFASNGASYVVLTNNDGGTATQTEVFIGKFNATYTGFTGWVQVTNNALADFTPDAWVGVAAPSPSMRFSDDSLAFTGVQGGANPAAQVDSVTTAYGTLSGVTASDNATWLTASVAQAGSAWLVTNAISTSGLSSGVYRATVTVNAPGAVPAMRTYRVKLTVTGTPAATSIRVSPVSVMVAKSQATQLAATVYDQMEQPMAPQPAVTWSVLAPANGVVVANGLVTASATLGLVKVVAASGSLSDTAEVNVVDFVPVDIKVNCGDNGPGYVPGWVGDLQFAVAGHQGAWWPGTDTWVVDVSGVTNPAPHDVYCRMRGATWYSIPSSMVPPGSYKVRLHFMEPYSTEATSPRSMTANIEGAQVMTGFRILTAAGGALYKAVVREFDVTVNGDGLQLQIGGTSAMIQGFEVISSGSLAKQLTLLAPLGGQSFEVGQVLTVRWSGLTSVGGIGIEMSPDGGSNWFDIVGHGIPTSDPDWGTYRWTIPATVGSGVSTVSSDALIRIYKYTDRNGVNDVSPSPVTIVPSTVAADKARLARSAGRAWAERLGGDLRINVPWQGSHTVELYSPDGRRVAVMQGRGAQQYSIAGDKASAGCLIVRITGGGKTLVERVVGGR